MLPFFTSINLGDSAENNEFWSQTDATDETDITCLQETLTSLFDSAALNLGNDDSIIFTIPSDIQTKTIW